ncbi:hypothetical protein DXV75_01490 [Alteromonas aestuariivivens]|uniref:AsmA family protein n=1 Tax=Alteromonas aestuariivivens TaxID=1938339 RepID=A0A3D8MEH5_9ALTE|nr:hypothetical protein [Alteromonas aestuariivivens]RDV29163.1 hypothetical protein DXV75_01490 [Alteromonas aestuariivivens]
MKKVLIFLLVLLVIVAGGIWYLLSGADEFIHNQIEQQGSRYLKTDVNVASVSLIFREGRLEISGLEVMNPNGFTSDKAFNLNQLAMDLGASMKEPYVIQEILIDAPQVLYEVNESGQSNLLVLKDNLQSSLPTKDGTAQETTEKSDSPLVLVKKVTVANTRLRINAEALQTGELKLEKKSYDVTLPTFHAGPIGEPDGLPADQVGAAIFNQMLANLIKEAKAKARDIVEEQAKAKAKEKLEEEKGKLLEKADKKLKELFKQ